MILNNRVVEARADEYFRQGISNGVEGLCCGLVGVLGAISSGYGGFLLAFTSCEMPDKGTLSGREVTFEFSLFARHGRIVPPGKRSVIRVIGTWEQNGSKTTVKWEQIEGRQVSKRSRINGDFAEVWSGRWESNPRPKPILNLVQIRRIANSPRLGNCNPSFLASPPPKFRNPRYKPFLATE